MYCYVLSFVHFVNDVFDPVGARLPRPYDTSEPFPTPYIIPQPGRGYRAPTLHRNHFPPPTLYRNPGRGYRAPTIHRNHFPLPTLYRNPGRGYRAPTIHRNHFPPPALYRNPGAVTAPLRYTGTIFLHRIPVPPVYMS